MDHNKISSDKLLKVEFVDTPYGGVCKTMEVQCVRCHKIVVVTAPDDAIKRINSEEHIGSAIIEYILEMTGWVFCPVNRPNGNSAQYSLCTECVEKDFEEFFRTR